MTHDLCDESDKEESDTVELSAWKYYYWTEYSSNKFFYFFILFWLDLPLIKQLF